MAKKKKAQKARPEYKLPTKIGNPEKLILSMDPGSANFGIALVGLEKGRPRVYANSVLTRPVNDLVAFTLTRQAFLEEIDRWMAFGPDGVIAERFQTRGIGGPLIEQVSSMIGLIGGAYLQTPIKATIASVWKNSMQRRFGPHYEPDHDYCDENGEFDLRQVYRHIAVQPHQLDAALIGVYGLEQGLGTTFDFDFGKFVAQVESTSLIPLRRRRPT